MTKSASIKDLFRFADRTDYVMMIIGSLAAIALGVLQPFIALATASIYGEMSPTTTPEEYYDKVSEICLLMVLGGILCVLFGSFAMGPWISVGSKQGLMYRKKTFKKLIKKECEWFDSKSIPEIAPSLSTYSCLLYTSDAADE